MDTPASGNAHIPPEGDQEGEPIRQIGLAIGRAHLLLPAVKLSLVDESNSSASAGSSTTRERMSAPTIAAQAATAPARRCVRRGFRRGGGEPRHHAANSLGHRRRVAPIAATLSGPSAATGQPPTRSSRPRASNNRRCFSVPGAGCAGREARPATVAAIRSSLEA